MNEKIKLTKEMWDDFLDYAVDSAGASGWKWFKEKYGLTPKSLETLLLENQEKADTHDEYMKLQDSDKIIEKLEQEIKVFKEKLDSQENKK